MTHLGATHGEPTSIEPTSLCVGVSMGFTGSPILENTQATWKKLNWTPGFGLQRSLGMVHKGHSMSHSLMLVQVLEDLGPFTGAILLGRFRDRQCMTKGLGTL